MYMAHNLIDKVSMAYYNQPGENYKACAADVHGVLINTNSFSGEIECHCWVRKG